MSYLGEFFRCSQRSVSSRGKTGRVNDSFTSSGFLLRDMSYAHLDLSHIRISTNLNELRATDNASRARYVKTMGVQGIVVQVPCIVVKKIQIHHG